MNIRLIEGGPVRMITVRLPPELKEAVHDQARRNRMSLNSFCVQALAASLPDTIKGFDDAAEPMLPLADQKRRA